ncbi:hypothetical protein PF007_g22162 [Phytophthora fragariae]|uniref:Helicase ATP-binding domain-containing protein n=1 Tax=Phytophthora fragariae TaxID=53985 RepID=A0A6A3IQX3_9STRA|nr:hypothetical protein PF003_g26874 [Phytophthora fragariae]KAE8984470.1 hypothetical protein PF011_g20769 [Phytophthora fragariae]KAE9082800.1 hypothetical protein PF007_g22162 [Phytophthora fragariae]KAE9106508.1 hypothetical protein PF006_g21353 [Phytophthora fragariae]
MAAVKAELSAAQVLELLVPRFDDLGVVSGNSVPVALDLSASLDVQLVFWEHSGVVKELECVNVEEGCPRCKFESFLRGLVILRRRGALLFSGAYVVEDAFARLRLRIEARNDIEAASKPEEFSFVWCHLQLEGAGRTGATERDVVAAAKRSRCHVVGCNLHRWKAQRAQVTPERASLSPRAVVSTPSPFPVRVSTHVPRANGTPTSSTSSGRNVTFKRESQEPIRSRTLREVSMPSPSIEESNTRVNTPILNRKFNLPDVFHTLMTQMESPTELWSPNIPGLDLKLYEHQRRGLSWMMNREKTSLWETSLRHPFSVPGRQRHESDHLLESDFGDTARDVCGGMLCDEPGLGKTIIMLALILLTKGQSTREMPVRVDTPTSSTANVQHRSSSRGRSLRADDMVSSSACLIAVPDALVEHWAEQIEAHVMNQGLKTYVDKAVAGTLPNSKKLARYDVVIVSFSRMAKEWKLHRPPSALETRRTPRYGFEDQPDRYLDGSIRGEVSSLLSIHWLRVVVDEGHKLGGRAPTQLMQMSRLLCAERRWVMSGTPSPNTLQSADLQYIHGLLVFLRNQPYGRPDGYAWSKAIARPFERNEPVGFYRLQFLLSRIMIRHTKDSIRDKLPRPIRHTVVVDPTPSEFKLYNAIAERVRANLVVTSIDLPDTTGTTSSIHPKSLLNRKNHKDAGRIETGLAFAFMGGYALNWTMDSKRKERTVEKLRSRGVGESRLSAVDEYLSTVNVALQPDIRPVALEDDDKPARRKKPRTVTAKKRKRTASAPKRAVNYKRDFWKIDSSKIFYMATRIRELMKEFGREQHRDLKIIIFSQFRESIWRTKLAFNQQDIPTADFISLITPHERIKNLEAFRSKRNVHVLLLSNLGSHGLDLSFVSHIFLLEEIWDKSVEMQVISRAHRMGARRSVVVEQLWMRGTVECQLTSTNQQLFKSEHSIEDRESSQRQPTREEVQEASSADKSSFQQLKMNYILNNLRVLGDDIVGKDGEVRFSVRDESETIIRQGVHTISDSGKITTVNFGQSAT